MYFYEGGFQSTSSKTISLQQIFVNLKVAYPLELKMYNFITKDWCRYVLKYYLISIQLPI